MVRLKKNKVKLEAKINKVLSEIESAIRSDSQDLNKEELPKPINSDELKEKLSEINKRLKEPTK